MQIDALHLWHWCDVQRTALVHWNLHWDLWKNTHRCDERYGTSRSHRSTGLSFQMCFKQDLKNLKLVREHLLILLFMIQLKNHYFKVMSVMKNDCQLMKAKITISMNSCWIFPSLGPLTSFYRTESSLGFYGVLQYLLLGNIHPQIKLTKLGILIDWI